MDFLVGIALTILFGCLAGAAEHLMLHKTEKRERPFGHFKTIPIVHWDGQKMLYQGVLLVGPNGAGCAAVERSTSCLGRISYVGRN